jgi:hypothetical protein
MTSNTRALRIVQEFEQGAGHVDGFSIRHGIAAVLRHIAYTEYDMENWTLQDLADTLTAPTLLERAMEGNSAAAKQFLYEAGFTDKQGYFLPQYQPRDNPHD